MNAFENLQDLIELLGDAPTVTELTITGTGGAQVSIKRSPGERAFAEPVAAQTAPTVAADAGEPLDAAEIVVGARASAAITANRVGVFHPAKPPVSLGDTLAPGQIVGYIESMKLMNEVRSEQGGEVVDVLIDDNLPVEYGQPVLRVALAS